MIEYWPLEFAILTRPECVSISCSPIDSDSNPDSYFPMTGAQPLSKTSTTPATSTSTSPPPETEEMSPLRRPQLPNTPSYGSMGSPSRTSGSISPKLDRVPEERPPTFISIEDAEEEVELDLEDQGYFVGKQVPSDLTLI